MDARDVPQIARSLGVSGIAIIAITLLAYILIDRVVSREDTLIQQGAVASERLLGIEQAIEAADEADRRRFQEFVRELENSQRITEAWLRANCYAQANGDQGARMYCDEVGRKP